MSERRVRDVATKAIESGDPLRTIQESHVDVHLPAGATKPLQTALLPPPVSRLFQWYNPAAAALILIVSSFWRGSRVGYFAIPGAAIALVGPALVAHEGLPFDTAHKASMIAGAVVAGLGLVLPGDD
jgi:hypothetical protein